VLGMQNDINNDLLKYVGNTTAAVNSTLNTIEDEINKVLTTAFNGTILFSTISSVVYCVVGSKIDKIEQGLTWVHDHAKVSFPLFPNDTFSSGAKASVGGDSDLNSFLASPSSVTSDDITAALNFVLVELHNGLVQEVLISISLLLVYIAVVLGGTCWALTNHFTQGGPEYSNGAVPESTMARATTTSLRGSDAAPEIVIHPPVLDPFEDKSHEYDDEDESRLRDRGDGNIDRHDFSSSNAEKTTGR